MVLLLGWPFFTLLARVTNERAAEDDGSGLEKKCDRGCFMISLKLAVELCRLESKVGRDVE